MQQFTAVFSAGLSSRAPMGANPLICMLSSILLFLKTQLSRDDFEYSLLLYIHNLFAGIFVLFLNVAAGTQVSKHKQRWMDNSKSLACSY